MQTPIDLLSLTSPSKKEKSSSVKEKKIYPLVLTESQFAEVKTQLSIPEGIDNTETGRTILRLAMLAKRHASEMKMTQEDVEFINKMNLIFK